MEPNEMIPYPEAKNGDVYVNPLFGDLWVVQDSQFVKINDGYTVDTDDPDGFVYVGHIREDVGFGADNITIELKNEELLFDD